MVIAFHSSFYAGAEAADARVWSGHGQSLDWVLAGLARAWIGVPWFFVISGYCIAATADRTRQSGEIAGYFRRRFRRIYPPFWIFLGVAVVVVGGVDLAVPHLYSQDPHSIARPWYLSPLQWLGNLTLTETWRPLVTGGQAKFFLGHAWTLCYEEQFYLVVGAALTLTRQRFFTVMAAVTLLVLLIVTNGRAGELGGTFADGRWLLFAAGLAVYYAVNQTQTWGRWGLQALLFAGLVWSVTDPKVLAFEAGAAAERAAAFSFALLLCGLHRYDQTLSAWRWVNALGACGVMCYSVYLVHWPIAKAISHGLYRLGLTSGVGQLLVALPLCVTASLGVGRAFHCAIERRFLNPKSI